MSHIAVPTQPRTRAPRAVVAFRIALVMLLFATAACGSQRGEEEFAALYGGMPAGAAVGDGAAGGDPGTSSGAVASTATSPGVTNPAGPGGAATSSSSTGGTAAGPATSGSSAGGVAATTSGASAAAPAGGSGQPPAPDGGAAPAAAQANPGAPVRIGSIGTLGGPVGSAVGGGVVGVQAWVAAVNASGGVAGHPIELEVADDGGDPARYRALVQEFVEDRGVVAFVHNAAPLSGQAALDYLQANAVPVIGTEGGSPWALTDPMHFPQMPSDTILARTFAYGLANYGSQNGLSKVAVITCAEIQGCESATQDAAFDEAGLDLVYKTSASLAAPDFTSQCLNARDAGAEMFLIGMDAQSVQRVADSCNSVGFTPVFAAVSQAVAAVLATKANLDGMLAPQATAPWFSTEIPGVAEFASAMQTFAPGQEATASSMQGWVSAELLEAAIVGSPGDPTTSAGILEGLYSLQGNDLGGLTLPLTFTEGAGNNAGSLAGCFWDVRIAGGSFTSPNNGQRVCP